MTCAEAIDAGMRVLFFVAVVGLIVSLFLCGVWWGRIGYKKRD